MLELNAIQASYGNVKTLFDVSLTAKAGEVLCLMGRNGAGKTTTLKCIMGQLPLQSGTITMQGAGIDTLHPHEIPKRGIGYVPQGRRLFSELSVAENLDIGLLTNPDDRQTLEWVLDIFPRLRERWKQAAGTLSGGEQQMVATARALCVKPKVLLLDEPTEGLQPSMIEAIRQVIIRLREEGVAIILVEQRMDAVMAIADRVSFIENGRTKDTLTGPDVQTRQDLFKKFLGV